MAKDNEKVGFIFKAKPYIFVLFGYAAVLLLLVLIIDNFLMPYIVHSNEKVRVPDIIGQDQDIAEKMLKDAGLTANVTREIYSTKYAEGAVITQTPNANAEVKAGRPIFLTLSKGKETVPVPYLIGSNLRNARVMLMQRGLELGDIQYEFNEIYPKDTIYAQSKQAGNYVPYGDRINIFISKGSENQNRIPNLIGFSYDEVHSVLSESGFIIGVITYKTSETYLPNTIIDQNPKSDHTATEGTMINLVISK